MQEWTILEDMSGVDFAGVDNDGGNRRWTTMEWISPTIVELTLKTTHRRKYIR